MHVVSLVERMKQGIKKIKDDLEKESVYHGSHKPHCCDLPEEVLHKEPEHHPEHHINKKAA